jgi:spermidine synthase
VERVLILGGGDGLAAREVLRHPQVRSITLVDLDPAITGLATSYGELAKLNGHSMTDPKMRVLNTDAMRFLAEGDEQYDVVIVDFPDPNNFALGKLYTTGFYKLLKKRLAPDGVAVVQSTSPLFARRSFWCVAETLKAAGFWTQPYHALVPSFGEWGYVLVAHEAPARHRALPEGLKFLDESTLDSLTQFPPDMGPTPAEVNRLNNQVLVHYYEEEWRRWN